VVENMTVLRRHHCHRRNCGRSHVLSEIRVNQGSKVKTAAQRGSAVVDNARNLVCVFESRMSEVSSGGGEYDRSL
jgi:hypothetical protein